MILDVVIIDPIGNKKETTIIPLKKESNKRTLIDFIKNDLDDITENISDSFIIFKIISDKTIEADKYVRLSTQIG